jgi:hypothetical protein
VEACGHQEHGPSEHLGWRHVLVRSPLSSPERERKAVEEEMKIGFLL